MRVLITGIGGVLGGRVAQLVEGLREVTDVAGIDVTHPDVALARTTVTVIDPRERRMLGRWVARFAPTVVVHLGVYEPDARASPHVAAERTQAGTTTVLGSAAQTGALEHIVLRSGLEVYGRRRGSPLVPDETVVPDPTTPFGRSLMRAERLAVATAQSVGIGCSALRFAPVVGPDHPSPLARYLRLRVVPVSAIADPPMSLLHVDDAARAVVAAMRLRLDGPLNLAGRGAVTTFQALRLGNRIPLPVLGPSWTLARRISTALGSPVPEHLLELLQRGRVADTGRLEVLADLVPEHSTRDCATALFTWPTAALARHRNVRDDL